jgi:hypothetical protein
VFIPGGFSSILAIPAISLTIEPMPNGYYLVYVAAIDAPYWHYRFGHGPKANNAAGTIPRGGLVHLQRPPDTVGTHQSAWLDGVGRVLVRLGDFLPAPAVTTNS